MSLRWQVILDTTRSHARFSMQLTLGVAGDGCNESSSPKRHRMARDSLLVLVMIAPSCLERSELEVHIRKILRKGESGFTS